MSQTADVQLEDVRQTLAKMKRRQERHQRAAFARGLMQGICSMLQPGDVVLDCGANVGKITKELAGTGAQVHAFEPDPYAFGQLEQLAKDHANVTLHNVAVGTSECTVRLMRSEKFVQNPKGGSVKSTVVSGGRGIAEADNTVEVRQIDLLAMLSEMIDTQGEIAFLKMDIEGAELDILEAMLAARLFDRIRLTVAETHERKFKALRPRFKALRAAVAKDYPVTRVNLDWI